MSSSRLGSADVSLPCAGRFGLTLFVLTMRGIDAPAIAVAQKIPTKA